MIVPRKLLYVLPVAALAFSCASYHRAQGDAALERMAYRDAVAHYAKAIDRRDDRELHLRSAVALMKLGRERDAADHFRRADAITALDASDRFQLGRALMTMGERTSAADEFMRVLEQRPEHHAAAHLLASCIDTDGIPDRSTMHLVEELGTPGIMHAFAPHVHGERLYFVGEREANSAGKNPWNGMAYLDLYQAPMPKGTTALRAEPLPGSVNGIYHEGPVALSENGRELYFTRSDYLKARLLKDDDKVSHLMLFRALRDEQGRWGDIHAFPYNGYTFSVGHPALSADGNTLYFVSDMPGSIGGTDIWRCHREAGSWSKPENLGPTINTMANELFPTINGDVLHFSSEAHLNLGGLDIFETREGLDGWSVPRNLGTPINGPHDDMSLVLLSDGRSGFFSSDRDGGDRLYRFTVVDPEFDLEVVVMDEEGERYLPHVEVRLTNLEGEEDLTAMTGPDGRALFRLDPDSRYRLSLSRDDLLTSSREVSTLGMAASARLKETVRMRAVEVGRSIVLNNIYYDLDKWDIRPDAARELDKLVRIINDNPHLRFELGSHTDARGSDMYNLLLSDARANSAVDYLIRKGADPDRILAQGFGESRIVNRCRNGVKCSEEEHQENRRTEFTVTEILPATTAR